MLRVLYFREVVAIVFKFLSSLDTMPKDVTGEEQNLDFEHLQEL